MSDLEKNRDDWLRSHSREDQELVRRGCEIVRRMVGDAELAVEYWALRLSMNKPFGRGDEGILRTAGGRAIGPAIELVAHALETTAILAALRISDNSNGDRTLSACNLAGLLCNERVTAILLDPRWLTDVRSQKVRIEWFSSRVPLEWGVRSYPPDDDELAKARQTLKVLRDKHYAHSDRASDGELPTYIQATESIMVAAKVAATASLIFLHHASRLLDPLESRIALYDPFWEVFTVGLLRTGAPG